MIEGPGTWPYADISTFLILGKIFLLLLLKRIPFSFSHFKIIVISNHYSMCVCNIWHIIFKKNYPLNYDWINSSTAHDLAEIKES